MVGTPTFQLKNHLSSASESVKLDGILIYTKWAVKSKRRQPTTMHIMSNLRINLRPMFLVLGVLYKLKLDISYQVEFSTWGKLMTIFIEE